MNVLLPSVKFSFAESFTSEVGDSSIELRQTFPVKRKLSLSHVIYVSLSLVNMSFKIWSKIVHYQFPYEEKIFSYNLISLIYI